MFCLAALHHRPVRYHSRWLLIVLWLSVHLGQLAPTTLPQCPLDSNSRCAGLSLSLAFRSVGLSLSLSVCLALFTLPRGFIFLLTLPKGFFSLLTLPTLSLCSSLPRASASSYPPPLLASSFRISPFAWLCAQERVKEPYSVPCYRVRLPDKCFLILTLVRLGRGGGQITHEIPEKV